MDDVFVSLARKKWNVKVKVKGQLGHQGQKTRCALPSPHAPAATEGNVLAANNGMQQQTGPFRRCRG